MSSIDWLEHFLLLLHRYPQQLISYSHIIESWNLNKGRENSTHCFFSKKAKTRKKIDTVTVDILDFLTLFFQ